MFCNNCGAQLEEGTKFCAVCGAPVVQDAAPAAPEAPAYEAPAAPEAPAYEAPTYEAPPTYNPPYQEAPVVYPTAAVGAVPAEMASACLKWGIMALAFASTFWLSFLGIVFGVKAKKATDEATAAAQGPLSGKAKVGSILGKVGLILGIVMTAILAIYLLVVIIGAIAAAASYGRYY